tara:strand:- start:15 stop:122 length:108 start_codon:yes stop_codon:yes gene_type:complete
MGDCRPELQRVPGEEEVQILFIDPLLTGDRFLRES